MKNDIYYETKSIVLICTYQWTSFLPYFCLGSIFHKTSDKSCPVKKENYSCHANGRFISVLFLLINLLCILNTLHLVYHGHKRCFRGVFVAYKMYLIYPGSSLIRGVHESTIGIGTLEP